jgi:hypothetical protein
MRLGRAVSEILTEHIQPCDQLLFRNVKRGGPQSADAAASRAPMLTASQVGLAAATDDALTVWASKTAPC